MALLRQIKKTFEIGRSKKWYDTYWAFDFHGTIIKPTYDLNNEAMVYYPYAKEALQLISERDDIIMIAWTCSYPNEIQNYIEKFEDDGIKFKHTNANPGISSNLGNFGYYHEKFYFNVLFEDKAGFDPETEWKEIHDYLIDCNISGYLPDPRWSKKY